MSNYHQEIMNIPVAPAHARNRHYKEGHCNARHAAAEIAIQADVRIFMLESALHAVNHILSDMHDNSPACLFSGAKGDDIGCLSCLAQMQIEKGLG